MPRPARVDSHRASRIDLYIMCKSVSKPIRNAPAPPCCIDAAPSPGCIGPRHRPFTRWGDVPNRSRLGGWPSVGHFALRLASADSPLRASVGPAHQARKGLEVRAVLLVLGVLIAPGGPLVSVAS